jgi:hypothetical protein
MFEHDRGGTLSIEDQFEDHAAAGAGATAARQDKHATRQPLAAQRVMSVDDLAGHGVRTAPEAERGIGEQHLALGRA